jgi:hypothetical protein
MLSALPVCVCVCVPQIGNKTRSTIDQGLLISLADKGQSALTSAVDFTHLILSQLPSSNPLSTATLGRYKCLT